MFSFVFVARFVHALRKMCESTLSCACVRVHVNQSRTHWTIGLIVGRNLSAVTRARVGFDRVRRRSSHGRVLLLFSISLARESPW